MVRFLSRDGDTVTGLLMPRKWSPKDLANDPRLDLMSGKAVAHFLKNNPGDYWNPTSLESGGLVTIQKNRSGSGSYTIPHRISQAHRRRHLPRPEIEENYRRFHQDWKPDGGQH